MNEMIPKIKPSAPLSLKKNVINKIKMERKEMKKVTLKKLSAVAAIFIALMMLPVVFSTNSEAKAAMRLLGESIDKSDNLKTMVIKFLMLTTPNENFISIREDGSMTEHTFTVSFDNPNKWRLEKSGRTAMFDGVNSYMWGNVNTHTIKVMSNEHYVFLEDFEQFLEPQKILRNEQQLAKNDGSEITMTETKNQIMLTVTSKAKGDFTNDYSKNSSIVESDNKRIYTFDKETKLLQALTIQIFYNNKYHTVLETTSILYDVPIDMNKLVERPEGEWMSIDKGPSKNAALTGVTSKEAAKLIFTALANKNIKPIKEALTYYDEKTIKEYYGLELLEIGDSFKSGLYAGEFVPYKIKFANGKTYKGNLALRNDNQNKIWVVDGGF